MAKIHEDIQSAKKQSDPHAAQREAVEQALAKIKNKFLVMSGKGGVGKTSTSVNLAVALSNLKHKVGLIDVDLHGPDVPRMLGLSGVLDLTEERKLQPQYYSEYLGVVSVESLTPNKDDAIIWRGPIKYSAIQQFIGQVAWGELDYLIIDAPPGTGDEPLTVAQTINDAQAIIVTTPQEVALADVRKSINFCRKLNMKIFGLIENMSSLICPHCNNELELFGSGGGKRTADAMGIDFLGKVPFDPKMVSCGDAGLVYQEKYPDSAVSRAFIEVARRVIEATG